MELVRHIEAAAADLGLSVIRGSFRANDAMPHIEYDTEEAAGGWSTYLRQIQALGARFVALTAAPLEHDEWVRAWEEAQTAEDAVDRAEVIQALERAKHEIGQAGWCALGTVLPGYSVVLSYAWFPEWHDAVYETEAALHGSADEVEEEDDIEGAAFEPLDNETFERYKARLANDPMFQAARNLNAREFAAKKILGQDAVHEQWELPRLVREAYAMYEVEIKPAQEAELRRRAREMLVDGKTKAEVAEALGLPTRRLTDLLR